MHIRKLCVTVAMAGLIAGCSVQGKTTGTTAPGEASSGLFGMNKTDDVVVETGDAFKGKNQVVIGGFDVTFLEEKKASQKAGGGLLGSGSGGKSSAHMTLQGVTPEVMQAITEAAYNDFIARLQAAGYTPVDRAPLLAHEDFTGVHSEPSPFKTESSFFGGDVTQTRIAPASIGRIYTGGFAFTVPQMGAALFADKTKIPVLFVNYTIDFANAEGYGGSFRNWSSVEVGQGISIPPGSGVQIIGGQGGTFSSAIGSVKLGQPVYSTESFGEVVGTTSEAAAVGQYAVNVISLLGGMGSNISKSYDVKADPARYQAVTLQVLAQTNDKLATTMGSLR